MEYMEKWKDINILYEDNHLLVVIKPFNLPTCPDESKDNNLLDILKDYIKNKYNKPGNVYLGLIHRLDRPVSGIMVFAKTSKAAERLSKQIKDNTFNKTYYAVIKGNLKDKDTLIDYLIKDEKTHNTYTTSKDKGKEAILNYEVIDKIDDFNLVKINLITGRHHQIRVQFSSRGYPLYGDHRYNKEFINDKNTDIALIAKELSFYHPVSKELLKFEIDLPKKYPWNTFQG